MNPDYTKIFTQSSCLTHSEMLEYVSGKLSVDDKRRIEIHIADCDMCNDELEGLSNMKNVNDLPIIINSIQNEVESIIDQDKDKFRVIAKGSKINLKRILSVAASVALLITIGFIINDFSNSNSDNLARIEAPEENIFVEDEMMLEEEAIDDLKVESAEEKSVDKATELKQNRLSENPIEIAEDRIISTEEIIILDNEGTEVDSDLEFFYDDSDEIVVSEESEDDNTVAVTDNSSIERKNKLSGTGNDTENVSSSESSKQRSKNIFGMNSRNVSTKKSEVRPAAGINYISIRNSGLLSYDIKSYKEAAIEFDKYLMYKPEDYEIVYKSGMSNYFLKKYTTAIERFDNIISGDINMYVEDAQWHKSMALINLGKEADALKLLNQIVFSNGKYQKRALEAINQLENK